MKTAITIVLCIIAAAILAGCGGGGGESTPPSDTDPLVGTWRMVDGNATLTIAADRRTTLTSIDGYGGRFTLTGTTDAYGHITVSGVDSRGDRLWVWSNLDRSLEKLVADQWYVKYDNQASGAVFGPFAFRRA